LYHALVDLFICAVRPLAIYRYDAGGQFDVAHARVEERGYILSRGGDEGEGAANDAVATVCEGTTEFLNSKAGEILSTSPQYTSKVFFLHVSHMR
jgi:hypothetical protein